MSTHNIRFYGEIRKNIPELSSLDTSESCQAKCIHKCRLVSACAYFTCIMWIIKDAGTCVILGLFGPICAIRNMSWAGMIL